MGIHRGPLLGYRDRTNKHAIGDVYSGKISDFVAHIRSVMWDIGYPFSSTAPRPDLNTEHNRTDTDREDGHYANR